MTRRGRRAWSADLFWPQPLTVKWDAAPFDASRLLLFSCSFLQLVSFCPIALFSRHVVLFLFFQAAAETTPPFLPFAPLFLTSSPCFLAITLSLTFTSHITTISCLVLPLLLPLQPCAAGKKQRSIEKKDSAVSSVLHHCTSYHTLSLSAAPRPSPPL